MSISGVMLAALLGAEFGLAGPGGLRVASGWFAATRGGPRQSAWVIARWDDELAADRADGSRRYLAVTRDGCALVYGRVVPDRMVGTLA